MIHDCDTCKHRDCWEYAEPCASCGTIHYGVGPVDKWEPQALTNYDTITRKSPEELAAWLVLIEQRIMERQPMLERPALYADWLNWLKEARE